MTPHDALAVVGVISLFVLTTIGILRGITHMIDSNRTQRAHASLGRLLLPPPAAIAGRVIQRSPRDWASVVASVVIAYGAASLAYIAVGGWL